MPKGVEHRATASVMPKGVGVLDLRIRVEHPALGIDRQAELLGHAVPLGVRGPPAVFRPRGLALACDGALELAVETHTADGGPLLDQALVLLATGPIDGGVVRGCGGPGTCEPDLLAGIDSPLGGQLRPSDEEEVDDELG